MSHARAVTVIYCKNQFHCEFCHVELINFNSGVISFQSYYHVWNLCTLKAV